MSTPKVPAGLVLAVFAAIVYGLYKLMMWLRGGEDNKKMPTVHGFGIDAQTRRRRLDLTRKDNTFNTSIMRKVERQRRGIFGFAKRRRVRRRRRR